VHATLDFRESRYEQLAREFLRTRRRLTAGDELYGEGVVMSCRRSFRPARVAAVGCVSSSALTERAANPTVPASRRQGSRKPSAPRGGAVVECKANEAYEAYGRAM